MTSAIGFLIGLIGGAILMTLGIVFYYKPRSERIKEECSTCKCEHAGGAVANRVIQLLEDEYDKWGINDNSARYRTTNDTENIALWKSRTAVYWHVTEPVDIKFCTYHSMLVKRAITDWEQRKVKEITNAEAIS